MRRPSKQEVQNCQKFMKREIPAADLCTAVGMNSLEILPKHANLGRPIRKTAESALQIMNGVQRLCPVFGRIPKEKRHVLPCSHRAVALKEFLRKG